MIPSRHRVRALGAAVALVLLVAACGGDDGGGAEVVDDTTTTEAASDTTEASDTTDDTEVTEDGPDPVEDDPEDDPEADEEAQDLAESVILVEDDFVGDWTAQEPEDDGEELLDCVTEVDIEEELVAEADSPEFSLETAESLLGVASTGLVFSDEDTATTFLDEVDTNQFAGCALDQLVDSLEEDGATVTDSDLTPAGELYPIGDQSVTLNGFFSVDTEDGSTVEGEISLTLVRTAEVVTGFSVFDIGDTEFAATVDEVATVIGDRHEAELG